MNGNPDIDDPIDGIERELCRNPCNEIIGEGRIGREEGGIFSEKEIHDVKNPKGKWYRQKKRKE